MCDDAFVSKEDLIRRSDVVIVGIPHDAYRGLETLPHQVVVDVWGVLKSAEMRTEAPTVATL